MIHRRLGGVLAMALAVAVVFSPDTATGACRSTTCGVSPRPPGCARDPVSGCWTSGIPISWPSACVTFSVDDRGIPSFGLGYAESEALVVQSFAAWPTATCPAGFPSISVRSNGPVSCYARDYHPEGPNSNAVVFYEQNWPHQPTAVGLTTVTFGTETGRITDADLEINLEGLPADEEALRYVLVHESGHFFGIDHSADMDAIMHEQYPVFGTSGPPMLTADDISAMCAIYPPERVAPCNFEPERGYSPVCGGDLEGGCALGVQHRTHDHAGWLLPLLFALIARVRRTRRLVLASD